MKTKTDTIQFRSELPPVRSIVVKVGSRILADNRGTPENRRRIRRLVEDIAGLRTKGIRVILVSSGAIAHGMTVLGLEKRPATIPAKQACASIGQSQLMERYEAAFRKFQIPVGQVLLTWDDLRDKTRYLNVRNTLFQLLTYKAIPIVNENDSVGVQEIRFGDNDALGAQIALLSHADLYVILTDVNGLYEQNPAMHRNAPHIPVVSRVGASIHALAGGNSGEMSVGGMTTKLLAAEQVTKAGHAALIGNGFTGRLRDVLHDPALATLFLPSERKMKSRARWIAFVGKSRGKIVIDDGACNALVSHGKSLLPAGVTKVRGTFQAGDPIDICASGDRVVARGLVNYSAEETQAIRGLKSTEIPKVLGQKPFDEVVHRDNLVVLED